MTAIRLALSAANGPHACAAGLARALERQSGLWRTVRWVDQLAGPAPTLRRGPLLGTTLEDCLDRPVAPAARPATPHRGRAAPESFIPPRPRLREPEPARPALRSSRAPDADGRLPSRTPAPEVAPTPASVRATVDYVVRLAPRLASPQLEQLAGGAASIVVTGNERRPTAGAFAFAPSYDRRPPPGPAGELADRLARRALRRLETARLGWPRVDAPSPEERRVAPQLVAAWSLDLLGQRATDIGAHAGPTAPDATTSRRPEASEPAPAFHVLPLSPAAVPRTPAAPSPSDAPGDGHRPAPTVAAADPNPPSAHASFEEEYPAPGTLWRSPEPGMSGPADSSSVDDRPTEASTPRGPADMDLDELAAAMKAVLDDAARRHGIEV